MHIGRIVSLVVCAAACGGAAAVEPARKPVPLVDHSFAVADVRVFDGERVLEHATVVVRGGRIAAVGRVAVPGDVAVVDGAGRTLLPGLIDAHAHVRRDDHLRDALRFGVTTELDMLTEVDVMRAHLAQRDQIARTDLADMYSAGAPVTSTGGLQMMFDIPFPTLDVPEDAERFVGERLAEGSSYIKVLYEPDAGMFTSVSRATLAAVVAAARARGVRVIAHVSSSRGAREAVDAGVSGLAHLFSDAPVDDELIAKLRARHVFVTATLSIMIAFDGASIGPTLADDPRIAPFLRAKQVEQLRDPPPGKNHPIAAYLARFHADIALANVRRLHAAGVTVLAGDDAPNLGTHGASLHGELELLTRAGLPPIDALRAATRLPADAFGLADRGRVTVGSRADLVLVDGNPLVDITATRAIVRVFKNGFDVPRRVP